MAKRKKMSTTDKANRIARVLSEFFGIDTNPFTRATNKQFKKIYKIYTEARRKRKEQGIQVQTLQQYDAEINRREQGEAPPREQADNKGYDFVESFKQKVTDTYNDFMEKYGYIETFKGRPSAEQQEAYFKSLGAYDVTQSYYHILQLLDEMVLQAGYDEVAREIAADPELEYIETVIWLPPSGWKNEMETTVQHLQAIMQRINTAK